MKTVVITGALGFIGHHLTKYYLDEGWSVVMIDDLSLHTDAMLTKYRMEYVSNDRCEFIHADCKEINKIISKLDDYYIRTFVHLAGIPNQASAMKDPIGAMDILNNLMAMCQVANHFPDSVFVHASSSMAYGDFTLNPQPEDALCNPQNLYGRLKLQSEEIVKLMLPYRHIIVRPSAVYGPGDNADRVIGKWIRNALRSNVLEIHSPAAMLDFTFVEDLVKGIYQAAERTFVGNTYNLTYGQARSLGEVAQIIRSMSETKSHILYNDEMHEFVMHPKRGTLDISRAKEHFNYKPKVDIMTGITRYLEWSKKYYG